MSSFDQLNEHKKAVLVNVAKRAYDKNINPNTASEIANELFPYQKARYRCCVYKEREIIRERVNLALGKDPFGNEPKENQFVFVLEAACDDCNIHRVRITDNCRKCLFKPCTKACHFNAIKEGRTKMHIDYAKCKACPMCARACPYGSILLSDRPCHRACPTGALLYEEESIAKIEEENCINCGRCSASCPFGAISERSFIVPVINDMLEGKEVVAMVAPAIIGQWGKASLKQVYEALHKIGFTHVMEVAQGADLTTAAEAKEALEAKKEGRKITTSCCPAFVDLLKLKFPKVYENHTSNVLSPMAITARMARKKYPNAKTVFVGPCVAKKTERLLQKNRGNIDYVLTFEEITAMFAAKGIDPIQLQGESNVVPGSPSGRNFCVTGGVAGSLNAYLQEIGETERLTLKKANGNVECIKFVKELQAGKQVEDVLEGMMCEGGCIAGVDSQVANALLINGLAKAENEQVKSVTIESSKEGFEDIDCYFDKSIN